MYRLPRAVLTQILAVRRKKEQGLPVDDGTEGWMLELVELMEMQVRILCCWSAPLPCFFSAKLCASLRPCQS